MSFFNHNPQSADLTIYYIPICKKIDNFDNSHAWILAEDGNFNRLFYSSAKELYQAQQDERSNVFCYKVSLTPEQCTKVAAGKEIKKGRSAALGFAKEEIISCIEFTTEGNKEEYQNRFYRQETLPMSPR